MEAFVTKRLFTLYPSISIGKSAVVGLLKIVTVYNFYDSSFHSTLLWAVKNKSISSWSFSVSESQSLTLAVSSQDYLQGNLIISISISLLLCQLGLSFLICFVYVSLVVVPRF